MLIDHWLIVTTIVTLAAYFICTLQINCPEYQTKPALFWLATLGWRAACVSRLVSWDFLA